MVSTGARPNPFSIVYGVSTHIGRRQRNQDEVLVTSVPWASNGFVRLFAVADGMGGHPGGEIASRLACDRLEHFFETNIRVKGIQFPADIGRHLIEAVIRTDRAVRLRGQRDDKLADMGTTLSCLVIAGHHSVIAHVGDSRIYRWRKGRLSCLTVDHTFVQDMIFEGEVDPAQAHLHPLRHMLTRAVGTGEPLELVDTRTDMLKANDCFLLCTDGLYNTIDKNSILDSLAKRQSAADTATGLVKRAVRDGARDNITAVVVRIKSSDNRCQNSRQCIQQ